jgi:hypothetical protein
MNAETYFAVWSRCAKITKKNNGKMLICSSRFTERQTQNTKYVLFRKALLPLLLLLALPLLLLLPPPFLPSVLPLLLLLPLSLVLPLLLPFHDGGAHALKYFIALSAFV